jgi:tetratricopeptide (TPR) repeat protein
MRRLIPTFSAVVAATVLLVAIYLSMGDREQAPQAVNLRVDSNSGFAALDAHAEPSKSNVSAGFHAQLETLRLRLAAAPDDTALLMRTARLLDDAHQPGEAIIYYERYLAIDPGSKQVWLDVSNVYAALGRWENALEATESVLKINPDDLMAMYNLGAIYANMGRYEEARSWWEKVQGHPDGSLADRAAASLERLPNRAR